MLREVCELSVEEGRDFIAENDRETSPMRCYSQTHPKAHPFRGLLMRIVATLVCTFVISMALPSLSFAGSDCDDAGSASDVRNCLKNNSDQKGKGNCNDNGNCNKAKDKAKNNDRDDYEVSCMEINNLVLRRQCLDKRRD